MVAEPGGGRFYVASVEADSLVTLSAADPGGSLEIAEVLVDGTGEAVSGLEDPSSLVASGDGSSLFLASFQDDAVSVLSRPRETGGLQQAQVFDAGGPDSFVGVSRLHLSPDGRYLYGTSNQGIGYRLYQQQGTGDWELVFRDGFIYLESWAFSPDGRHVYGPTLTEEGDFGLAIASRDPISGEISITDAIVELEGGGGPPDFFPEIDRIEVSPTGGTCTSWSSARMRSSGSTGIEIPGA